MSCFWKTKIVCLFHHLRTNSILVREKNRWKCKTLKWWTRKHALFFTLCHCKNLVAGHWSDFRPEKLYVEIFSKTNVVSITFGLSRYSWVNFKGNWFSDPKHSGPVLGRLPALNLSNNVFPRDGKTCMQCEYYTVFVLCFLKWTWLKDLSDYHRFSCNLVPRTFLVIVSRRKKHILVSLKFFIVVQ